MTSDDLMYIYEKFPFVHTKLFPKYEPYATLLNKVVASLTLLKFCHIFAPPQPRGDLAGTKNNRQMPHNMFEH